MVGGNGNDEIEGGGFADEILGGDGNDTILGAGANDTLIGGDGNDEINGEQGDDTSVYTSIFNNYNLEFLANDSVRITANSPNYDCRFYF